MLKVR